MLVKTLRDQLSEEVEFIVYYEQGYGEDLDPYMAENIRTSEAILALFGPGYKQRIDQSMRNTGCHKEYSHIVDRLENEMGIDRPEVITIFWSGGSEAEAFPGVFSIKTPYACDLTEFHALEVSGKKPFIPRAVQEHVADKLTDIVTQFRRLADLHHPNAKENRRFYFSRMLQPTTPQSKITNLAVKDILNLKFENAPFNISEFHDLYFTETLFFRKLRSDTLALISGRKGSGKTTIVQISEFLSMNENFYPIVDISVENWKLSSILQLPTFKQASSDFEFINLDVEFFDFVWPAFFAFCVFLAWAEEEKVSLAVLMDIFYDKDISRDFSNLISLHRNRVPEEDGCEGLSAFDYSSLFILSISCAKKFIQHNVDTARNESIEGFQFDVSVSTKVDKFISHYFGHHYSLYFKVLGTSKNKRHSICFDRFDTSFQNFRKDNQYADEKLKKYHAKLEIDWLSSLVSFVEDTQNLDRLSESKWVYGFYKNTNILLVIPFDREIDLRNRQRDAIKGAEIQTLKWQPLELMTMLRKRLEAVFNVKANKEKYKHPRERFESILAEGCHDLPFSVSINLSNKKIEKELFLNVLRHTFFRPRDILVYYASIISYYKSQEIRGELCSKNAIKDIISKETRTIVKAEFIGELKDTWINIDEVLDRFVGSRQVLRFEDLERIIGPVPFEYYGDETSKTAVSEKLDFLFDTGFLGYRDPRGAGSKRNDFNFSFLTNGTDPSFVSGKVRQRLEFAVHPIFIEYLSLELPKDQPVLDLTWDVIERMDRLN